MNRKRKYLSFSIIMLLMLIFSSVAAADSHLQFDHAFNPNRLEYPEGIAIDKTGNMYVSLGPPFFLGGGLGEVWKIDPDGNRTMLVEFPGGPGVAGLAVDAPGNLYFAFLDGVYKYDTAGNLEKLPGTENIVLANGLALDKRGDLYISDSIIGAIWKLPLDGSGDAAIWYQGELLVGCGDLPVGANGIAFRQGSFYVANTSLGLILKVEQQPDGNPGSEQVVAGDADCDPLNDELFSLDGIAFDNHGDIYAALVIQNKLVKINPDTGSVTTLLTEADGIHNPASLAFGTGMGDRQRLFFTNFAVIPGPVNSLGPAVLSIDTGVPGQPLP